MVGLSTYNLAVLLGADGKPVIDGECVEIHAPLSLENDMPLSRYLQRKLEEQAKTLEPGGEIVAVSISLNHREMKCSYCGGTQFYQGPSGGISTNVMCANPKCEHWFNYHMGLIPADDLHEVGIERKPIFIEQRGEHADSPRSKGRAVMDFVRRCLAFGASRRHHPNR